MLTVGQVVENHKHDPIRQGTKFYEFLKWVEKTKPTSIAGLRKWEKIGKISDDQMNALIVMTMNYFADLMIFGSGRTLKKKYKKKSLRDGIKVEREHSNYDFIAKKIAKDHLDESKVYYDLLAAMENSSEFIVERV